MYICTLHLQPPIEKPTQLMYHSSSLSVLKRAIRRDQRDTVKNGIEAAVWQPVYFAWNVKSSVNRRLTLSPAKDAEETAFIHSLFHPLLEEHGDSGWIPNEALLLSYTLESVTGWYTCIREVSIWSCLLHAEIAFSCFSELKAEAKPSSRSGHIVSTGIMQAEK